MADKGNRINWEIASGQIKLIGDGKDERLFTLPGIFIQSFKEEIVNTAGKATFKMAVRKTLEILGASVDDPAQLDWEDFAKYNDEQILPVALDESQIPTDHIAWDGSSRDLTLLPEYKMTIWTVNSFNTLKKVLEDILTEKGANAILQSAGKKAGLVSAEQFAKFLGWKSIDDILNTFDQHFQNMNPIMGWSQGRAAVGKCEDGEALLFLKMWNSFEAQKESNRPSCVLISSFFAGNLSKMAELLAKQSADGREVKCTCKGDSYCAVAIKIKAKGASHVDWKELEAEWAKIDAESADLKP